MGCVYTLPSMPLIGTNADWSYEWLKHREPFVQFKCHCKGSRDYAVRSHADAHQGLCPAKLCSSGQGVLFLRHRRSDWGV